MKRADRFLAAAAMLGAGILLNEHYLQEKRAALARVRANSQLIATRAGLVEASILGSGNPVLVLHGAGGGWDQGKLVADHLLPPNSQTLAISRPGYRRTPLESGRLLHDQADLYAALLDVQGIDRAAILGISAGGLSALEFAARYPDRCTGLILVSAVGPGSKTFRAPDWALNLLRVMLAADGLLWAMIKLGSGIILQVQGVSLEEQSQNPGLGRLVQNVFPPSDCRAGTVNDLDLLLNHPVTPLETIRVPTLIVHGEADRAIPAAVAQFHADSIPNSQLTLIKGASHFGFITSAEFKGSIASFLITLKP